MPQWISLDEADVRWVFPGLDDTDEVTVLLRRADVQVRQLAEHLGVTSDQPYGGGLHLNHRDGEQVMFFGLINAEDVSFHVMLTPTDTTGEPRWHVDGQIDVRCDGMRDCGAHVIEETESPGHATPQAAAEALLIAATWLCEHGTAKPLSSWRLRDADSGHP